MPADKPQRSAAALTEQVGEETLITSRGGEAIHVLNGTAGAIWQLCDGRHTTAEIAAEVATRFAAPAGIDVLGDVQRILAALQVKGLLEPA